MMLIIGVIWLVSAIAVFIIDLIIAENLIIPFWGILVCAQVWIAGSFLHTTIVTTKDDEK